MTSILSRYIGNRITAGILLVIAIVLGLDVFIAVLSEQEKVMNGYSMMEAVLFVMSTIPRRLNDYLPYCIMIGCLFGLGGLASTSELTVVRAAGISVFRIILIVLRPVILFIFLGLLLSEYVAPLAEQVGETRRNILRYGSNSLEFGSGVWSREGNQFMHFSAVETGGVLHGVSIYGFDDQKKLTHITHANKAIFQENKRWQMESVARTVLKPTTTAIERSNTLVWNTDINPDMLSVLSLKPKRLSISDLWEYAEFKRTQGLDNGRFLLSFWQKALQPLATLALAIAAMSFIFGPTRQATMGFRLFCGVAVGMGFRMVQDILAPASLIYGFSPAIGVIVPALMCFAFAWFMLRKT